MTKGLYPEKMKPDEIKAVEERMRPGKYALSGFLDSKESLLDIVKRDAIILGKLNVSYEQIAQWLTSVMVFGKFVNNKLEDAVVDEKFRVNSTSWRGSQECPFHGISNISCGRITFANTDFKVTRISDGKTLSFSGLMPHLIENHHFFEGNVPYRIEPEEVVEFFK